MIIITTTPPIVITTVIRVRRFIMLLSLLAFASSRFPLVSEFPLEFFLALFAFLFLFLFFFFVGGVGFGCFNQSY